MALKEGPRDGREGDGRELQKYLMGISRIATTYVRFLQAVPVSASLAHATYMSNPREISHTNYGSLTQWGNTLPLKLMSL